MIKYLTLRNKLDYSLPAFFTYVLNNVWALMCWAFGTYLLPVHSVIFIMVFMVMVDFITGVWKSVKLQGRSSFSSKRIGDTIEKLILYMIGIITSFVLQTHIGVNGINIMWVFGTLIITREYVSIIENIEILTGTKLLQVIRNYLSKTLPDIKDKPTDKDV